VSSFGSRTHQDFGYLKTEMVVQPGRENAVIDEVLKISEELRRQGVSEEELVRAREPILTALAGTVKTNRYWLNAVLALSSRHPQQLEWAKSILSDYGAVSADEVSKLAARYLDSKRAAVVSVRPSHSKGSLSGQQGLEE
jgi:zinc protease